MQYAIKDTYTFFNYAVEEVPSARGQDFTCACRIPISRLGETSTYFLLLPMETS
jgi:hypothetical protein